jgi:NAD/NADP transhydrogenase beta subunit
MEDNKNTNDPFHLETSSLSSIAKKRMHRNKKQQDEEVDFLNQEVRLDGSIFFPYGYENIMLFIYFITIPYLVGLIFIFFYIGGGDYTVFLSLDNENSFMVTWAIGYEVVAAMILLWIAKLGIVSFFRAGSQSRKKEKFKIP